jgi:CubicO group peptidase (beta-lactamase class C family)
MSDQPLPPSTPEAQGIASGAILEFIDAAESSVDALHSFILVRHGHVVAEGWWDPYRPERPHMMFSVSKSFTSTAVGLAASEGHLSVDDAVLPYFPDAAPETVSDNLAAMRIRHLLTMTTGHAVDTVETLARTAGDADWAATLLALPVEHEPGTRFVYNSGASYLLSAIVQRVTGERLLDYLRPRLLAPLGITDATWSRCPRGVDTGGWGLSLRTADIARFGQLYLDEGRWAGRQLVPRDWVRAATAHQVDNSHDAGIDWCQGYGYQFWRSRHGTYRGDGAFGQFCLVLPAHDAVLATTAGTADMQAVLDLVWQHLLPAMRDAPLPPDEPARQRLTERLAGLRLPPVPSMPVPRTAARISGQRFIVDRPAQPPLPTSPLLPAAPQLARITLTTRPDGVVVSIVDGHGDTHELVCGDGEWHLGTTAFGFDRPAPVAASGAWIDDETYLARFCYPQTPFVRTVACHFAGPELTVTIRDNVSFTDPQYPPLRARVEIPRHRAPAEEATDQPAPDRALPH